MHIRNYYTSKSFPTYTIKHVVLYSKMGPKPGAGCKWIFLLNVSLVWVRHEDNGVIISDLKQKWETMVDPFSLRVYDDWNFKWLLDRWQVSSLSLYLSLSLTHTHTHTQYISPFLSISHSLPLSLSSPYATSHF